MVTLELKMKCLKNDADEWDEGYEETTLRFHKKDSGSPVEMSSTFPDCEIVSAKVPVKCLRCGHVFVADAEIADEQTTELGDMGPKIQRVIEYEGKCPNCSNHVSFEICIWEYPPGSLEEIKIGYSKGVDFV